MLLEQLALRVDHLRLDPDAELHSGFLSRVCQCFDASGKFVMSHFPVTQACMVIFARIFVSEPSVIKQEHVHAQVLCFFHQSCKNFLIEVESRIFPVVQQGHPAFLAVLQLIVSCPSLEVAASRTGTFVA